jgi:hypothetical protein
MERRRLTVQRGGKVARIDDTLARRFVKREGIREILKRFLKKRTPLDHIPRLSEEINLKEPDNARILLDIMMEENDEIGHLALLLLSESPNRDVIRAAEKIFVSHAISEEHRARLAALLMLHHDITGSRNVKNPEQALKKYGSLLDAYWKIIDPIDLGHIWLSDYQRLSPREKIPLLETLFSTGSANYLPIYSIEIGSRHPSVSRYVAENLTSLNHEDVLTMLKSMPDLRDTATRLLIEETLKILEKKKRKGEILPRSARDLIPFYKAYVAEVADMGVVSVIISRRKIRGGPIRYLCTFIDHWDRGISNSHVGIAQTAAEFISTVHLFNQNETMAQHDEVEKDYALWLLKKGEELTIDRGYYLPPEYLLGRRILWDEKFPSRNYDVKFGLTCCECGVPIRTTTKEIEAWLIGDTALCQQCISKKTHCENCGKHITPEECYALAKLGMAHVTVICETCYQKTRKKTKNPRDR